MAAEPHPVGGLPSVKMRKMEKTPTRLPPSLLLAAERCTGAGDAFSAIEAG